MENALLVLKTADAVSQSHNTINTWSNINLRNLLGMMYDKYEVFNLQLNTIATGLSSSTLGTTLNDLNVSAHLTGLPFINQTYDVKTGNNSFTTNIGVFRFARNTNLNTYYTDSYFTFGKSQDMCNLTISLTNISDGALSTSVDYPDVLYIFNIIGVPNKNDSLLIPPSRMDNNTGRLK